MTRRLLTAAFLGLALVTAGIVVPAARADGLPVIGVDAGPGGVTAPGAPVRYVALPAARDTVVARVERDGGRVLGSVFLRGTFTVPAVALDGSASGLSADGRTLVLIRPRARFPRAETTFAVLDANRLRLRNVVTLRGDFSFDALSPDGSRLYLVEYVSPRDSTRYVVRAYDVRRGRLLPEPVVDPRERGETMRGYPITRATSPDGRWAYTLYDGTGGHPFIHALDTAGHQAVCIDLHALAGRDDLGDLRFDVSADGRALAVVDGEEAIAAVNTRTFTVSEPRAPAAERARPRADSADGGASWPLVGAAVLSAAAALSLALRARRRVAPATRGSASR